MKDITSIIIYFTLTSLLIYFTFFCDNESFSNIPFIGYELSPNFKNHCSFINFNRPDKTNWNLFMLVNKFRYSSIIPFMRESRDSSLTTTPILIVPGLGDCLLKDGNDKIWQPNNSLNVEKLKEPLVSGFDSSNSNLTPFIEALRALRYTSNDLSIQSYDFRNITNNLTELFLRIRQTIIRLRNYSNLPVIIVGQDLGCVLLNLFLNRQQESFIKENIKEFICVGSTFGGTIKAARDFTLGIKEFHENATIFRNFDGLKLQLPNQAFFDNKIVIKYNDVDYSGKDFVKLLEHLNIKPDNFETIYNLQKESLVKPSCEVTFINNSVTNAHNRELYDYWSPRDVITIEEESSKLFNDFDAVLYMLKKLKVA